MSFLSKKRTVSLSDHFYHLLGFRRLSACCGEHLFRHFYRNDSHHPFLTPYKQLDAGSDIAPKIASVCCYLTWFWTQYLSSFRSWKIFLSCHPFDYFYRFNYCFLFPTIFLTWTKLATLIG